MMRLNLRRTSSQRFEAVDGSLHAEADAFRGRALTYFRMLMESSTSEDRRRPGGSLVREGDGPGRRHGFGGPWRRIRP